MGKSWMIASGKGGVGKSTLTAALAVTLAMQNRRVVIVDADIGLRGIDLILGMQDRVIFDLFDYISGQCTLAQALIRHMQYPTLSLLSAPQTVKASEISAGDMRKLAETLKQRFDIVLLDCPAGVGRNLKNTISSVDECILVTTPDEVSIRDVERIAEVLKGRVENKPYLVINRIDRKMIEKGEMATPGSIAEYLDMPLIGEIPDEPVIYRALLNKKTASECDNREVRRSIEHIALRMQGRDIPFARYHMKHRFQERIHIFFSKRG